MPAVAFYIFSGVAILFSLLVIFLRSPITSTLSLVVSFFAVSGIFVLLDATFLGVIQILIYAGAIMVLFLYVTMLLNVDAVPQRKYERLRRLIAFAAVPALVLAMLQITNVPDVRPGKLPETFGTLASIGEALLGPWALLFELISVVLLAGIVGAVLLSSSKRERVV